MSEFNEIYFNTFEEDILSDALGYLDNSYKKSDSNEVKEYLINKEEEKKEERKQFKKDFDETKELRRKVVDLYVNDTKFILMQYVNEETGDSTYSTLETKSKENNKKLPLQYFLGKHLLGQNTIGVFANKQYHFSKFLTFDVDTKDIIFYEALIEVLHRRGINDNNILVSFSGNKGYHVDIFFNKNQFGYYPSVNNLKVFYYFVLLEVHDILMESNVELTKSLDKIIEFRPTAKSGCKLPLSYHYKTGNYCNLFEDVTLEEETNKLAVIERLDRIELLDFSEVFIKNGLTANSLKKYKQELHNKFITDTRDIDVKSVLSYMLNYMEEVKADSELNLEEKLSKVNDKFTVVQDTLDGVNLLSDEYKALNRIKRFVTPKEETVEFKSYVTQDVMDVIEAGRLLETGTRNEMTYKLLTYFYNLKNATKESAIEETSKIIANSQDYMSTDVDSAISEVVNMSKYIKKLDSKIYGDGVNLTLSKNELDALMILIQNKKLNVKQLDVLLAIVKASRIKESVANLECSYSYLDALMNKEKESKRSDVLKHIISLHNAEIITFINKEVKSYTIVDGNVKWETNKFNLNIFNTVEDTVETFIVNNKQDFIQTISSIYSKKVLRSTFSKRFYTNNIKDIITESATKEIELESVEFFKHEIIIDEEKEEDEVVSTEDVEATIENTFVVNSFVDIYEPIKSYNIAGCLSGVVREVFHDLIQ